MKRWVKYSMRESKRAELAINLVAGMIIISDRLELVTLLVVLFLVYFYHLVWIRRNIRNRRILAWLEQYREMADNRLELLRKIIELGYTHKSRKDIFYSKVCELVRISELKRSQIVDFEPCLDTEHKLHLSRKDLEFYCLLEAGFSDKELSIVYGHSNFRSIYVKKNRILHKMKSNGHSIDVIGEEEEDVDLDVN